MRVLMLGWEFPPSINGGLGTACHGLVTALDARGVDVNFVMPRPGPAAAPTPPLSPPDYRPSSFSRFGPVRPTKIASPIAPQVFEHVTFDTVPVTLHPYAAGDAVFERRSSVTGRGASNGVGRGTRSGEAIDAAGESGRPDAAPEPPRETGMLADVRRYTGLVEAMTAGASFDVIHAHDWMTFPAGLAIAARTGKPLVAHVHSTESDRAGPHGDTRIADIERRGVHGAVRVIAVSQFTKSLLVHNYGVDPAKVDVVYNAVEPAPGYRLAASDFSIRGGEKIVLFLGRITSQKGPEFFLTAARKVLEVMDDVRFVMAGDGDMARETVELAATLGIAHKMLFTGFLRGLDVERIFQVADLFVMPSVSEPFGIAPLEAIARKVPTIISKQSGVSEVLKHALKVDFWDTNELANKIVAVLRHPTLAQMLREQGGQDVAKLTWADAAKACMSIYADAIEALVLKPDRADYERS